MKKILILILALAILPGCTKNLFNFTIVSTKRIDLEKLSLCEKSSEKVTGEDKASLIVIIPTRVITIDQAISNTIAAIPGCIALMDGTVYSKFWYIPYIYGEQRFVIEATPVIDPSFSQSSSHLPKYGQVYLDKEGKVDLIESITEVEYLVEKSRVIQNGSKQNKSYTQH